VRRRDFISLLGAAAAWPVCARAQSGKTSRIGFLGTSSLSQEIHLVDAFRKKLRELGHVEGSTFAIEFRWAEGRDSRLAALAAELVRLKPDVIVTAGTPGSLAAKRATSTIPIVFASSGNPVAAGLVPSFSRPGGNITGFTVSGPELEGKRVQLLKEVVPQLSRVAVVWNSANPAIFDFYQQTRAAGAALGFAAEPNIELSHADGFNAAFTTIASCLRTVRRL
jgi:putative ABC transport system substrate-binding protein